MAERKIWFATNRRHKGKNQWNPRSYGREFSRSGMDNLRFGEITVPVDAEKVARRIAKKTKVQGKGNGTALAGYFSRRAASGRITAYRESLDVERAERGQPSSAFGSSKAFAELQKEMLAGADTVILIHGYNVSWKQAVGTALGLQEMLNRQKRKKYNVVLFSWPSDGSMMPYAAYKSDRDDASASASSFARALLKLRDFLADLRAMSGQTSNNAELCQQGIHLVCHSMGNYVLQGAAQRVLEFNQGRMPRIFQEIALCSADVDDDVLEKGEPLGKLHQMARRVTVYSNTGDVGIWLSRNTKGNPERLGAAGISRPELVHSKVQQISCDDVVGGVVEHSYYMDGDANNDLLLTLQGRSPGARPHIVSEGHRACWKLKKR